MKWPSSGRRFALRARRGITFPFVVLLLATFIGLAAFTIDFSRMWVIRTQLQRSSDAAALAGIWEMIRERPLLAYDTALVYTQRNTSEGVAPDVGAGDIIPGRWNDNGTFTEMADWTSPMTNAIRVTTHHTGQYIFGPIYGAHRRTMSASATAVMGYVSGSNCVRPLAIPYEALYRVLFPAATTYDTNYVLTDDDVARLGALTADDQILLKIGDASDALVGGNFYAVREGPIVYADGSVGNPWQGGNEYRSALSGKCPNEIIRIGDWLQGEQGNMVGPTRQGVASACNVGGGQAFTCSPALEWIIAIWDRADKSIAAPNAFHVNYIGVFKVTGYNSDGITGYFSTLAGSGYYSEQPTPVLTAILRQ